METYEAREIERDVYAVWASHLGIGDDFTVDTQNVPGHSFTQIFRVVSMAKPDGTTVEAVVKKVDNSLASGQVRDVVIHLRG